jgi:hypothetical protein
MKTLGIVFLILLAGCGQADSKENKFPIEITQLDDGLKGIVWLPGGGIKPNQPWVWFAPTWITNNEGNVGGMPSVAPDKGGFDIIIKQFNDRGIALVGVDVGITFGNKKGRDGFSKFYKHLTQDRGFSQTGCMLLVSQGGMMGYTWILENPGVIKCVGGIFPITSVEDYHGLSYFAHMWGITEQFLTDNLASLNPLHRAAEFNFPIMHIHGDQDQAARIEYARQFFSATPQGTLVELPGVGHEYKRGELFENDQLIDFVIKHTK